MFEGNARALTIEDALDCHVREFLAGKKRDRSITDYTQDLEKILAVIPINSVADLSLKHLGYYALHHTLVLSAGTPRRRLLAKGSFLPTRQSRVMIPFNVVEGRELDAPTRRQADQLARLS